MNSIKCIVYGKLIISSNELGGAGTSLVNQDGVTGFVIFPKDSKALARAIQKILEDKN
ncbi:MAG: glycosyltransferase [Minisyncoccia bacterium]